MIRLLKFGLFSLTCLFLFGCAHPIKMTPDLALIRTDGVSRIDKKVGYHISEASKALEVTGPGGGGDKVRYFPYRDFEAGFYMALNEVFTGVTRITDPKDSVALKKDGLNLLITPEIETMSSSPSLLTWPPTQFAVNLTCRIMDVNGTVVETIRITGDGRAEFDEFKGNFSLSATRASNDTLKRLIAALSESKLLRQ